MWGIADLHSGIREGGEFRDGGWMGLVVVSRVLRTGLTGLGLIDIFGDKLGLGLFARYEEQRMKNGRFELC